MKTLIRSESCKIHQIHTLYKIRPIALGFNTVIAFSDKSN